MSSGPTEKAFVMNGLKVIVLVSQAWSTHEVLRKYLQERKDEETPVQLLGIIQAGIIPKMLLKWNLEL